MVDILKGRDRNSLRSVESKLFLLSRNYREYDLKLDKHAIKYVLPALENPLYYGELIRQAVDRVNAIVPVPDICRFFYARDTADFNYYGRIWGGKVAKKKGDWVKGWSLKGQIATFIRPAIESETSILKDHRGNKEHVEEHYKALQAHELTHESLRNQYSDLRGKIPGWLEEATALMAGPYPDRGDQGIRLLSKWLEEHNNAPAISDVSQLSSVFHQWSFHFTKWLFDYYTTPQLDMEERSPHGYYQSQRVASLVHIMELVRQGLDFTKAFSSVYGIDYQEAYIKFKEQVKDRS